MITQSELKEFLHYDPDTGIFTWIQSTGGKQVGSIAGTVYKDHTGKSYINIQFKNKIYRAHRLSWLYMSGKFPDDEIDHVNGNGSDNRFINLRSVTRSTNRKNLRLRSNNTSGVCGVYFYKRTNKWLAAVGVKGKFKNLGYFLKIEDAILARKNAEKLYNFHANHGSDRPL